MLKLHCHINLTIPVGYCGSMPVIHNATIPNWNSVSNVTFNSVTLARMIQLPDDGPRTETCRSVFNVLMRKFYKFISVQWLV